MYLESIVRGIEHQCHRFNFSEQLMKNLDSELQIDQQKSTKEYKKFMKKVSVFQQTSNKIKPKKFQIINQAPKTKMKNDKENNQQEFYFEERELLKNGNAKNTLKNSQANRMNIDILKHYYKDCNEDEKLL